MPIYEYQCSQCKNQLEAFQNIKDKPLTECPVCHQNTLNKLVSAAGFQLKGSGWYATDYKAHGEKKSSDKNDEKPKTSSENKTETQTDTTKSTGSSSDKTGSS